MYVCFLEQYLVQMLYDLDGSGARTMLLLDNIHLLGALYLLQ